MTPPGGEHGHVAVNTAYLLKSYSKETGTGRVVVESGFYLEREPDTVRGPDVSFFLDRQLPIGYFEAAPDLAVEIVSPNDSSQELEEKVQGYLESGVKLVLVLHPRTRSAYFYSHVGSVCRLTEDDHFAPELLPEFSCKVSEFFED